MLVRLAGWYDEARAHDRSLAWEGTFADYFNMVLERPEPARLAHARVYDMIMAAGVESTAGDTRDEYRLFSGSVFGLADTLEQLVDYFKSAARRLEVRKRILLMMGPVGAGKSTIVSVLKRGLEDYTRTEGGAVYAIKDCPMHEEPLHLLPSGMRERLLHDRGLYVEGELCPSCRWRLLHEWDGDIENVPVTRVFFSEADRVGIGTFVPSDEKCVAGSTYVFTDAGMVKMEELHRSMKDRPRPGETANLDTGVLSVDGLRRASRLYNGGRRATRRIVTEHGYDLCCSSVHPLLVRSDTHVGWVQASHLTRGMQVALMVGAKRFGTERSLPRSLVTALEGQFTNLPVKYTPASSRPQWTRELARLAGYVRIGFSGTPIGFRVAGNRMAREVNRILAATLPRNAFQGLEYTGDGFVCRNAQAARLVHAMYRGVSAGEGGFSTSLRVAPMDIMLAFVSGLLLNGAHVEETEDQAVTLSLDAGGDALLRDVQLALLNAGVITRRGGGVLVLDHRAIRRLCDFTPELLIGVGSWVVSEQATRVAAPGPVVARTVARESQERARTPFLREALSREIMEGLETDTGIRAGRVRPAARMVWMRVSDVTDGTEHVYDLTVPGLHSYCADGFITHNSQDISELVGSVDFSRLGTYGTESDPRAYRFDGELNVSNRGLMEFVELLKAPEEFLYSLLSLSQEQSIKAGRFPLTYSDEVVIGHTNEGEYRAFIENDRNEALRDRLLLIRVPYNLRVSDEEQVYRKLLEEADLRGIHLAPHALQVASMFAVLTRLLPSKRIGLDLMKKLRLYNGENADGFTGGDLSELRAEAVHEGMSGLSPRFIINCLSRAVARSTTGCVTPIDVLCAIKEGMTLHPGLTKEDGDRYLKLLYETRGEYDRLAQKEVQTALVRSLDERAQTLFAVYLDNVRLYCNAKSRVDPLTGEPQAPDEELMCSIEQQIGIADSARRGFREELMLRVTTLEERGQCFDYTAHRPLREAIETRLLADLRGALRLSSSARKPDSEDEHTLRRVLSRLCKEHGYCINCARALVDYVSGLLNP